MKQFLPVDSDNLKYYDTPLEKLYSKFDVDPTKGLTAEQAAISLQIHGLNLLRKKKRSFWRVIIAPIINLLIIIYLAVAVALFIFGAGSQTYVTFAILGINAIVAIVQQLRAEKQLEALKKLSTTTSVVIRDGEEMMLPTDQIVIGDIIKFHQGDKIPADCRIIEGINLLLNESSLTGESEPVRKNLTPEPLECEEGVKLPIQDQKNMVFLGTFVSAGSGSALVVRIGPNTELGQISLLLEESSTGEIPLRKKMNNFARILGLFVVGVIIVFVIRILLNGNDFVASMRNALNLSVKVLPINLPLLTTIVLLTGVLLMAQKGVLVRELSSTESLGRVSTVCSDKTGTITKNEMTVIKIWTPEKEFSVTGMGYDPNGIVRDKNNARAHTEDLDLLILSGYLNNNASLKEDKVKTLLRGDKKIQSVYHILGLPTEGSLIVLGQKYDNQIDTYTSQYHFVHEFSFDSAIKRMSKIFQRDEQYFMFTKGATEWLLPLCSSYQSEGLHIMDEDFQQTVTDQMQSHAEQGYRVLSIAYKEINASEIPEDWDTEYLREEMEKDLVYLGFVVILDPPRDGVSEAVQECKKAGINVVMITGDNMGTGLAIAINLGIYTEGENLGVEGSEIESLSDTEFLNTSVYGRVTPEHKRIIIERYQGMKHVVAMTGDGINDALALSMADCGIAMGISGTEVAKEAADMVITDDSFNTIVTGIREGRGIFMKIRNLVYFFICVLFSEASILFISAFINPVFQLFENWQLNLIYLTTHLFPSLGFIVGRLPRTTMSEKPRDSAEIITKEIVGLLIIQVILIASSVALAYILCNSGIITVDAANIQGISGISTANQQLDLARTMAFMILFLTESLIMPMQIRRMNHSIVESFRDIDYYLEFLFYLPAIIILIVFVYNIPLQNILGMSSLNAGSDMINIYFLALDLKDWLWVIVFLLPNLVIFEIVRWIARRLHIHF